VLPRPEGLIALVAVSGALIPVATRHFAAQTAVVTVLVLALVMVGGEPQASASRITETLLACAIVLIVGHLPMPGQRGGGVRSRLAAAGGAAQAYLAHVLRETERPVVREVERPVVRGAQRPVQRETQRPVVRGAERRPVVRESARPVSRRAESAVRDATATEDSRALRWTLRREAYRALAEARTAIALAAAELPALARHSEGADEIVAVLERIVDTTTACAVHLDDSGRLTPDQVQRLTELLDELGRLDEGRGRVEIRLPEVPLAG
jgi:hypothetical protein